MLKRMTINQRPTPVPIPLQSLAEAVSWIDEAMIPNGQSLTSAILDGESIIDLWNDRKFTSSKKLGKNSLLELRIESPMDLALQGLETSHNLCGAILRNVKFLAVHLWQAAPIDRQPELQQMSEDIEIIIDLIDHARSLEVGSLVDFGPMLDLQAHLKKILLSLSAAFGKSDWRGCAKILLRDTTTSNGMETTLKSLQEEFESAHLRLLTSRGSGASSI